MKPRQPFIILVNMAWTAISLCRPLFGQSVEDPPPVNPENGTAQKGRNKANGEVVWYLALADPVGEFQNHVDRGYGTGLGGLLFLGENRLWVLRAEAAFVWYGRESRRSSYLADLYTEDVTTTYSIVSAGMGPQVCLGLGPIRPYLYGAVGFSNFITETEKKSKFLFIEGENVSILEDDIKITFTGGGGLSVKTGQLLLDLSASYQHNGRTKYLAEGAETPILSQANLVYYRVGVSLLF